MCMIVEAADLRYVLIFAINMLKSDHFTWDAFTVVCNPNLFKFGLVLILSLFISFISLRISRSSAAPFYVFRARPQRFSPVLMASLWGALILPQLLFFYFYPIILLFSTDFAAAIFVGFAQSLQERFPPFTIHFAHTNDDDDDDDDDFVDVDVEMAQPTHGATTIVGD